LPPVCLELLFEQKTTVRELIRRTVEENVNAQLRQSRGKLKRGQIDLDALVRRAWETINSPRPQISRLPEIEA
jgi:hypothetical protein